MRDHHKLPVPYDGNLCGFLVSFVRLLRFLQRAEDPEAVPSAATGIVVVVGEEQEVDSVTRIRTRIRTHGGIVQQRRVATGNTTGDTTGDTEMPGWRITVLQYYL